MNRAFYFSSCFVIVLWMNLSRFHDLQYSDSLLLPLTSLQAWTPFYWDQNRFGMLLPLLALPVQQPLANLLFQAGLAIAAGWLTLRLLLEYLLPADDVEVPFVCGAILILVALPLTQRFEVFGLSQPYGTSAALTLAGLVLLAGRAAGDRWRLPAASALILLGAYVNVGVIIMFGPLVVARTLFGPGRTLVSPWSQRIPHAAMALGLLALSFGAARGAAGLVQVPSGPPGPLTLPATTYGLVPLNQWTSAWLQFFNAVHKRLMNESSWEAIVLAVLCGGLLSLLSPQVRLKGGPRLRAGIALLAAGVACFLATGVVAHVYSNHSQIRYAVPALILVTMGAGLLGSLCLLVVRPFSRGLPLLASPALLLVVVATVYGRPGLSVVRHSLEHLEHPTGEVSRALVDARIDFFAGEYWTVWPAVFYALDICSSRGETCVLRGLSLRSTPSLSVHPPTSGQEVRVGAIPGDDLALPFVRHWLGPFQLLEEHSAGPLRVLLVRVGEH